jgi:hemolysin activation/secretion protein
LVGLPAAVEAQTIPAGRSAFAPAPPSPAQPPAAAILPSPPLDLARPQGPIAAPGSPLIIRPGPEAQAPSGSETIETDLADIVVDGSTIYTPAQLKPYFADLLGKRVPLSALYEIARRIEARYREDGYVLAHVVVPAQTVDNGRYRLRVVEGFVGSVEIQGDAGSDRALIRRYLDKITRSRPARLQDLERYLLLANDLPGIIVQAVLTPEPDETGGARLVADVHRKPIDGYATLDNRGSDFTGPINGAIEIGVNGLTGLGGRLEGLMFSTFNHQQNYGELSFSGNIGGEGDRARFYVSYGPSRPGSTLAILDIHSLSTLIGIGDEMPVIRSRRLNLAVNAAFEVTRDRTNILGAPQSMDRQRIFRLGAQMTAIDAGGAVNSASLTVHKGLDILDASHGNDVVAQSRADGTANFFKVTGTASRLQPLYSSDSATLALLGSLAGQYAANGLLALEQFRLGGEQFGRGYIPGELNGDDGLGASAELQLTMLRPIGPISRSQWYIFYDYGAVRDRGGADTSWHGLASVGGGVRFDLGRRFSAALELDAPYSRGRTESDRRDRGMQGFFRLTARF